MNKPLFALGVSLFIFGIGMLYGVAAVAHPGGLDANGCHYNRTVIPSTYECHTGKYINTSWESREAFEASIVREEPPVETPIETPEDVIRFANPPDWSTLEEHPVLFNGETVWTVSDGQFLYRVVPDQYGEYPLKPVSKAKIVFGDFAQLIQAIQGE